MSITAVLFTALALSMDAFAVSVTKGMTIKHLTKSLGIKIALFFGIFQGGMPLLGWVMGIGFEKYIKSIDHWIALILLSYLGYKMIKGFIDERKEANEVDTLLAATSEEELSTKDILVLSVATSIDALAVGISFAFLSINIVEVSIAIGVITFIMCLFGVFIGKKIGNVFNGYAELIGGIILIGIGINIFNEHTHIFSKLF